MHHYNFRKYFVSKISKFGEKHLIKELKKFPKEYLDILPKEDLEDEYLKKGTILLELKRFDEANDCFDKIIKMQGINIKEAYFYKGSIKSYLKDYESAIQCYKNGINQIDFAYEYSSLDDALLKELLIAHIQLYGKEKGLFEMLCYINKFIDLSPMFPNELLLRYRAQINYYLDVEKSLQDYESLYSKFLEKHDNSEIHTIKTGDTYNIIKCNLKIWKTTGINKFNEIYLHINKMLNHIYFPMNIYEKRKMLKDFCLSYLAYKLDNKTEIAKQFRDIIKQFCREIRLVKVCEKYPLTKLKKYLSIEKNTKIPIDLYNKFFKEHCDVTNTEQCIQKHLEQIYKESIKNLVYNNSVNLDFLSAIYNKWNISFKQQEIADIIMDGAFKMLDASPKDNKNYISKLKYLFERNISDFNTFVADDKKIISYCISWGLPLDFIKYLIEEKKVNYNEDKDILESIITYDMLKYFEKFKLPKADDILLFEVCYFRQPMKMLKYLIEEQGYNPKIKNEKKENLLFCLVNPSVYKRKTFLEIIDYLVKKYKLDLNEKNINDETILSLSLENYDYETANYLLRKYKVTIDKSSEEFLSKNIKGFLDYIYKLKK